MSRLPDHVIMCHIMLGSCHMLPRCALAGKLVFFCKTWYPWGQQTERKKDESADESSLDPCALLKGTSAALVDTGDRVWLIYIWNTLSSFPGTIRLTFLRFVQKCLCFCICACMCVFVCVCVCVCVTLRCCLCCAGSLSASFKVLSALLSHSSRAFWSETSFCHLALQSCQRLDVNTCTHTRHRHTHIFSVKRRHEMTQYSGNHIT